MPTDTAELALWMIALTSARPVRASWRRWMTVPLGRRLWRRRDCWSVGRPPIESGCAPGAKGRVRSRISATSIPPSCMLPSTPGSSPTARPRPTRRATNSNPSCSTTLASHSASAISTGSGPRSVCVGFGRAPPKKRNRHSRSSAHHARGRGEPPAVGRRARNRSAFHPDYGPPMRHPHHTATARAHAGNHRPRLATDAALSDRRRLAAHLGSTQLYRQHARPPEWAPLGLWLSPCGAVFDRGGARRWRRTLDGCPGPLDRPPLATAHHRYRRGAGHGLY